MKKKWTKKAEPKLCFFILLLNSKTLIELINSTLSSCCLLVSCVERMALGTNFHVNFRLCGTCYEGVSTVAGYGCLMVTWMNVFSHIFPLSAWFPTMRIRLSVIGLLGFHKAKSALAKIRYHKKENPARAPFMTFFGLILYHDNTENLREFVSFYIYKRKNRLFGSKSFYILAQAFILWTLPPESLPA